MPRAVWTGSISFGLVSIPVRLYPGTEQKGVRFQEFARGTARRVRRRRVVEPDEPWTPDRWRAPDTETTWTTETADPSDPAQATPPQNEEHFVGASDTSGESLAAGAPRLPLAPSRREAAEVSYDDVVKGYEVAPGQYVMVEREELEALRPTADRTIHIEGFVRLEEIDPVFFERSYLVGPGYGIGVEKPYGLLLAALERTSRVAVGRFVMRTREYLAAIRARDGVLGLETLFFADEVRSASDVLHHGFSTDVSDRELNLAIQLIDALGMDWDATRLSDTYRERVMDLIRSKGEGLETVPEQEPAAMPQVADLMAALRASVEEAKQRQRGPRARRRDSGTSA